MTPFLLYQMKAGLCIMMFTGLYFLLLRKETFYNANRFYLTGSLIISFILPLVQFPSLNAPNNGAISQMISSVTVYAYNTGVVEGTTEKVVVLPLIYKIIAGLLLLHLLFQLFRLLMVVRKTGTIKLGSFRIISLPKRAQSFSFFNLIFVSAPSDQDCENNQILQHELAHARQMHSADILILQFIKIFQWFNPFIYMAEKALQETHEYLADEAVLEQNGESGRYRLLLLTQVFGVQPGILSFFNYSLIKNRLTMMTKDKSPDSRRLRYLFILPVLLTIGIIFSCTNKDNVAPPPPPPPPPADEVESVADPVPVADTSKAFVYVDDLAKFQNGSLEEFREWVQENLVYPEEAVKKGIFGRVTVQFSVNTFGSVDEVKILRGVTPVLDEETVRVLKSSPKWTPAKKDGRNVKQQFVIPVIFQLQ